MDTMYILMPFRPELEQVEKSLKEVAAMTGFHGKTSKDEADGGNVVNTIVSGIYNADMVVADLTYLNPNVLYEIGIAHAMNRNCLMICQRRGRDRWVIGEPGMERETGSLPFDLASFDVTPYTNDADGWSELRKALRDKIIRRKGARIPGPVNTALDALLKRNRTAAYLMWGGCIGALVALVASLPRALVGSFAFPWRPEFFRTIFEGAYPGFVCGALALGVYSIVDNLYEFRTPRWALVLAETTAGCVGGIITYWAIFNLNDRLLGAGVATGMSLPYALEFTLGGLALGFAVNIQKPLERRTPIGTHVSYAAIYLTLAMLAFLLLISLISSRILPPPYLERFTIRLAAGEAIGYGLWGIGVAAGQWWLKWDRRI